MSDKKSSVEEAPTPAPAETAEDAELRRQQDVRDAVATAHADELPKLGGPLKEPGLGR